MKILKIVFGLVAAVILGYLIAAVAAFGVHYFLTGQITNGNSNLVVNSDLLSVVVEDMSGSPVAITQQNPVEVSMSTQMPFEISWQVSSTLASSNPICTIRYSNPQTFQRRVGYSGTLQIATSTETSKSSIAYILQCMVGEKIYVKAVIVNFQ